MSEIASVSRVVRIAGRVQGVGYRACTRREATVRGLQGWVRNRQDGSVEALFVGTAEAIQSMIEACHIGPRSAAVVSVLVEDVTSPPDLTGFHQRPTE